MDIGVLESVWGWIFGAGGVISTVVFWRKNIRLKSAEVVSAEVAACRSAIDAQNGVIQALKAEVGSLRTQYAEAQVLIGTQYNSISLLELKNAQKKTIIAQAHGCPGRSEGSGCPVLGKQEQIDEEYRRKLEQKTL